MADDGARTKDRDLRGDTIHPSTMEMLDRPGFADRVGINYAIGDAVETANVLSEKLQWGSAARGGRPRRGPAPA